MIRYVIQVYDFMADHKVVSAFSCVLVTLILIFSMAQLHYKEDISDFLPANGPEKAALSVYQDISGADRIFAVFRYQEDSLVANPDIIVAAISSYIDLLQQTDTLRWVKDLTADIELEKLSQLMTSVYKQIPYFLTEKDYARMDSLLNSHDYIRRQLIADKELLMFPTSVMANTITLDPLNLFTPVLNDLQALNPTSSFETYDGYIFTPGMSQALVMMRSPFGNSETQLNSHLLSYLQSLADSVHVLYPQVSVRYVGGPVIAVENARQIKNDSIWSVSVSVVLILLLLSYSLKRFYHLFLIAVSIAWGWIFAIGMLSVVNDEISLIVVGISSIILGIAINYPLHLIAHLSATPNVRSALKEVASPLIIGNITTVGAFLALVPIDAVALRDLGLFSTFLLIGTILFVILYLPHVVNSCHKVSRESEEHSQMPFYRLSQFSIEGKRWILPVIAGLTIVLTIFSTTTRFDANIANINYMTDEQRRDLQYFQQLAMADSSNLQSVYVVSRGTTLDEALTFHETIQASLKASLQYETGEKLYSCARFFTSQEEQQRRLSRWSDFVSHYRSILVDGFLKACCEEGFVPDAFTPYLSVIQTKYDETMPLSSNPLNMLLDQYLSVDSVNSSYQVVDMLKVAPGRFVEFAKQVDSFNAGKVYSKQSISPIYYSFDIPSMNSALANHLSANFNYIGWACSIIVFLFLWFSFGKIEMAILSFLPMAISWVWILGLMGLFDIHFNIVNIILATFIFGQGDDYTIFIVEGCCYEYAFRQRLLASYKSSIIISALIMFIGIGTLIFAKHPALYSLAQVTIIGMFSVVLMAFALPPIVFNWLVKQNGNYRRRPLTLSGVIRTWFCGFLWLLQLSVGYLIGFILSILPKSNTLRQNLLNKFVSWTHRIDLHLIPGVKYSLHNKRGEDFSKPSVIVCNHQSMLDPMCLMALSHKILIVANMHSSHNPVIRYMFRWLGFYTIDQNNFKAWQDSSLQRDIEVFRSYIKKGYSIAVFPEGVRNSSSSILRYHKGAFYLAHELEVDILPVIIHGMNNIMPLHSFMTHPGKLTVSIEERINPNCKMWGATYQETTKLVHQFFVKRYKKVCKEFENASHFRELVLERYMYKSADIYRTVKANLNKFHNYTQWVDNLSDTILTVYVLHSQWGEFTLMLALANPDVHVIGIESDAEKRMLATYSAEGLVSNLSYTENFDISEEITIDSTVAVYDTSQLEVI